MGCGRETFHISAYLGEQDLGRSPTDTRDRIKPLGLIKKRLEPPSNLLTELLDDLVEAIQVRQLLAEQKLLMRAHLPGQGTFQLCTLPAQAALGEVCQQRGVSRAIHDGIQHLA